MNNDINYDEVFGVETEGEREQESAVPAENDIPETDPEGEREQESAVPANDNQRQSPEENAGFAAARRRAEREAAQAVEKIRKDAAEEIDSLVASFKLVDPYTGTPITTRAQYDTYLSHKRLDLETKMRSASGMSDKEFDEYKNSLPEVVEAREHLKKMRAAEADRKLSDEISKIGTFDPTVKTVEDIAASPLFVKVNEMVKRGYDLSDAWRLANLDRVEQINAEKTRQAALNAYNGKEHMTPTASRGEGTVRVPDAVLDMYRAFNPDASNAEITRHYNKTLKT